MLELIKEKVIKGKIREIEAAVKEALEAGESASDILVSMQSAMDDIGQAFMDKKVYVPEMLVASKTMQRGVNVIKPYLATGEVGKLGKIIIGTVKGDLHDIGKNLVSMMLESAGFDVIDLGVDVTPELFLTALKENPDAKLIALSALLTTTMENMKNIVAAIRASEFAAVKIMVGGAPITQAFADEIGADAYTLDAASCAEKARELVA